MHKKETSKMNLGFTLSEVLITLGIIGVIASLTIPGLINNIQDANYKVAYRKAFADTSVVWQQIYSEYLLSPRTTGTYWNDAVANEANFQAFKSKFNIVKDCTTDNTECWNYSGEQFNNGTSPQTNLAAFIDSSGRSWVREDANYGGILVDTNGNKNPNHFGKDRFRFAPVVSGNSIGLPGIPAKIGVIDQDWTSKNANYCNYPPCYYTSWLQGAN